MNGINGNTDIFLLQYPLFCILHTHRGFQMEEGRGSRDPISYMMRDDNKHYQITYRIQQYIAYGVELADKREMYIRVQMTLKIK